MSIARRHGAAALALFAIALAAFAAPAAAAWRPSGFLIGGYHYTRDHDPASRFDARPLVELDAAGLDLVVSGGHYDSTEARWTVRMLDSLRARRPGFRLRTIVHYMLPWNPGIVSVNPAVASNAPAIRAALQPEWGINGPSVEGYMVWDEPVRPEHFENAGLLSALIDTLPATRGKLAFVNLLPIYAHGQPAYDASFGPDKVPAYERYLDRYLSLFDAAPDPAPLLCVDHYPFETAPERRDFYLNLRLMREAVERHRRPDAETPMWLVLQIAPARTPSRAYATSPTLAQIRAQASAALAYGVKGLLYWTLVPGVSDHYGPGLLDERGSRSSKFAGLARLNRDLHALGRELAKLDPVAAYHQDVRGEEGLERDALASPERSRELVADVMGGAGRGLVGWLRERGTGTDHLFVVNKDRARSRRFTVALTPRVRAVTRLGTARPEPVTLGADRRTFATPLLAPGAGALFRIER